jgi:hypothetical protein
LTKFPAWDSLLSDMLEKPDDVVVVSAKRRGRGHGGWSKHNPYLEEVSACFASCLHRKENVHLHFW